MANGTVGPIEHEVVWYSTDVNREVCLGYLLPLHIKLSTFPDKIPPGKEGGIKTSRSDNQVKIFLARCEYRSWQFLP